MQVSTGKILRFLLRWGVAVAGITWVVLNLNLSDRVTVLDRLTGRPVSMVTLGTARDSDLAFRVVEPAAGMELTVSRSELVTRPDRKSVTLTDGTTHPLLAVRPLPDPDLSRLPTEILIESDPDDPTPAGVRWIPPEMVAGGFLVDVPYPPLEIGLIRMFRQASPFYLWLAVMVFPVTFLITSFRWYTLLRVLDVSIPLRRAFTLTMVGSFYSTFMPGITGGDFFKAYYAAKNTTRRTQAIMSVIIDRGIGLLGLVLLGGTCAAMQWHIPECRNVAIIAAFMLTAAFVGGVLLSQPGLRRATGLNFLLRRLPFQEKVGKITDTLEIYGRRPFVILGALAITLPVHATVVVSAYFAGRAFNLPLDPSFYWVVVPVTVLAGSIPISPQGAGVMEFFAILLTHSQGVTVGQALALTLSIRFVPLVWNLLAGVMVLRGGYQAPRELPAEVLSDPEQPAHGAHKPQVG